MPQEKSTPRKRGPAQSIRHWFIKRTKKQKIAILSLIVILLAVIGAAIYLLTHPSTEPIQQRVVEIVKPKEKVPVVYKSTLTGLVVDEATSKNPVTAVMIENSQAARPQAALIDAGVVFEAVAEGGITRYLTLFQDTSPDYIGPVRSVRPYYIQWARGFDAAVAHVGGSSEALSMIRQAGQRDLDQFFNPGPYWRVSSRAAPHNMYSSIPKLRELQTSKGWGASAFTSLERKETQAASQTPTAKTIDFNISGPIYNSHYEYDVATNSYKRSIGGKPHLDDRSGQQISPKVVIGLVLKQGSNGIYTTYQTIGSGQVYIFQDGIVAEGTWEKTSDTSQFIFKDSAGNPIKLNAGKTWFSVVGSTDRVSFKP